MSIEFVDVETARAARGLRLVILGGVPSAWSQAAKAIVELKRIEARVVRMRPGDAAVRSFTGVSNAPVALYDDEPARTGWAEILALAERIGSGPSLVPSCADQRVVMHGLSHEILGEGGLLWSARLLMIEASLESGGGEGFALPVAQYLAPRYGYRPGCASQARSRMIEILELLGRRVQEAREAGSRYYLGGQLSALDVYSAVALHMLAPLPPPRCPVHRSSEAFAWMYRQIAGDLPPAMLEHRDFMHEVHLKVPVEF